MQPFSHIVFLFLGRDTDSCRSKNNSTLRWLLWKWKSKSPGSCLPVPLRMLSRQDIFCLFLGLRSQRLSFRNPPTVQLLPSYWALPFSQTSPTSLTWANRQPNCEQNSMHWLRVPGTWEMSHRLWFKCKSSQRNFWVKWRCVPQFAFSRFLKVATCRACSFVFHTAKRTKRWALNR